jgi:hypothetical protein
MIYEFSTDGVQSTFASGLDSPNELAFDSAGDLFVANGGGDNILEFTNNAGTLSTNPVTFANGLNNPWGLAFSSAGILFVGDNYDGYIYEYTTNDVQSTFVDGSASFSVALAFAPIPVFSVSIKMFAGIILNNGQIGSNYLIQATSNLSSSNWITLTNVTLPTNPYIYIDYSSATNSQQFYRAVEVFDTNEFIIPIRLNAHQSPPQPMLRP